MSEEYNKHILLMRPDRTAIYPAIDLSYGRGIVGKLDPEFLDGPISIEQGGTGATTVAEVRANLAVYSKSEIADLIGGLTGLSCVVVETLPEASADTLNKIYLILHAHGDKDTYDEYLTIKSEEVYTWEKIGNTDVDLTDYSKKSHTHDFSGNDTPISVSGSYYKATGISIDAYTPEGNIALSRGSDVALKTESINSVSNVGALPSLSSGSTGDISYLKDASLNNTLGVSYSDPTFNSKTINNITDVGAVSNLAINETVEGGDSFISGLTKENYTPEGSVSSEFTGEESKIKVSLTPTGSIDLGPSDITDGVKYVESVSGVDVSGTSTDGFVTGINGGAGGLTSSTTETTGDIPYLSELTIEDTYEDGVLTLKAVPSKAYLHHEHTAASISSTTPALTGVSGGTVTSSVKYLHPTFGGNESSSEISYTPAGKIDSTFNGASKQLVTDGSTKYIHFDKGTTPTVESADVLISKASSGSASLTGSVTLDKSTEYLNFDTGSLPSVQEKSVATGVSQQPEFTGAFTGTSATLTGKLSGETTTITSTGSITPSGTITSAIE